MPLPVSVMPYVLTTLHATAAGGRAPPSSTVRKAPGSMRASAVATSETNTSVAIGIVIGQTPAGGATASLGSTVDVAVSSGALVPSVVGLTEADAQMQILADGLTLGEVKSARNAFVARGDVISQSPAGNTDAEPGSAVDLVVSTGAFSNGESNGNAIDPWSLLLLMAVPLLRRRRR